MVIWWYVPEHGFPIIYDRSWTAVGFLVEFGANKLLRKTRRDPREFNKYTSYGRCTYFLGLFDAYFAIFYNEQTNLGKCYEIRIWL